MGLISFPSWLDKRNMDVLQAKEWQQHNQHVNFNTIILTVRSVNKRIISPWSLKFCLRRSYLLSQRNISDPVDNSSTVPWTKTEWSMDAKGLSLVRSPRSQSLRKVSRQSNFIGPNIRIWCNHRTAGIVDSLPHHVLPKNSFFSLQQLSNYQWRIHVGRRILGRVHETIQLCL